MVRIPPRIVDPLGALLGLMLLGTGVSRAFSMDVAMIVVGGLLLAAAVWRTKTNG